MPLFGAHMSIAGGYYHAADISGEYDCRTVQLFTKNNNQWAGKPLSEEDIRLFKESIKKHKLKLPTAHDSYLINLASPEDFLYRRSIDAFAQEIERAEALGLAYLVMHPGTPTDGLEDEGLTRIAKGLDETLHRCAGCRVVVLVEATAGQGKSLGHRFEHLKTLRERVREPERVGVCVDTCHIFAAGYPLWPEAEYRATFQKFDDIVGLEHLKVFHVNDSKKPLGSRVDRHEHIGKGCIGPDAFRLLVNDKRFAKVPMILETPKEDENDKPMDPVNLGVLRKFQESGIRSEGLGIKKRRA
jgi:deoxyribonuclease-4